jgi:hypothetical protein
MPDLADPLRLILYRALAILATPACSCEARGEKGREKMAEKTVTLTLNEVRLLFACMLAAGEKMYVIAAAMAISVPDCACLQASIASKLLLTQTDPSAAGPPP